MESPLGQSSERLNELRAKMLGSVGRDYRLYVHLWRENLRNSSHPLEECIQYWPEKPARNRHVGGAYATEIKKLYHEKFVFLMTISTSSLWQITADLGFDLLIFMEGSGFSDASSAVRKKRSCIHVSPLPSTPPSETASKLSSDENTDHG
uniref:Uncharacterized protein n=1 Tax=Salix viminalis TaxID=40686 RepID=A0A6N2LBD9_SALVM